MSALDIGFRFLQHYHHHGCCILPRSSLLDPATPMTFVGSAGLTQIETSIEQNEDHSGERYVLTQTCFRHFDLDKVGRSPVHLSLFEMGGAFAFGRVSREDTLGKIWRFLTGELGMDGDRLWVTYFSGGMLDNHTFLEDEETRQTWREVGVRPTQIVGMGIDGSFWKQGRGISNNTRFRKCGPTTEIFYDYGVAYKCSATCEPGCACGRFVEISNILFIHSYMDETTGTLHPLTTPFDETVIGVERLAMVRQQASSVFELTCFIPLIEHIRHYTSQNGNPSPDNTISERVIADHLRALLFLTADNAPEPGKGGRARIMRMLIRGVITHQKILNIRTSNFVSDLLDTLLSIYQQQFPALEAAKDRLLAYFQMESAHFEKTLAKGYRQLDRLFIRQEEKDTLSGENALELVKHFGFPLPLLKTTLDKRGIAFDISGYKSAYARWQRMVESAG